MRPHATPSRRRSRAQLALALALAVTLAWSAVACTGNSRSRGDASPSDTADSDTAGADTSVLDVAPDSAITETDRQALEAHLAALPAALCAYYEACDFIEPGTVEACTLEMESEIMTGDVTCDAMVRFYAAHRAEIDACMDGSQGTCANDDLNAFCPAYASIDIEHACDPVQPDLDVVDDSANPIELTLEQVVVGAWHASGSCGDSAIAVGWFLCPAGRLRGFETLGDYDFMDCGTWERVGDNIRVSYTATAVIDPSVTDAMQIDLAYDPTADTLTWIANCPVPMSRLVGGISDQDCETGTCVAGGTGPAQCTTDCDCGRCWYCESGTCRYAGEGPYGCYRGCGL